MFNKVWLPVALATCSNGIRHQEKEKEEKEVRRKEDTKGIIIMTTRKGTNKRMK